MRTGALAVAAAVLVAAGCGGSGSRLPGVPEAGDGQTLQEILNRAGPDVALTAGTSDYEPGQVRLSFLVIRNDGAAVSRPAARVWVARVLGARPFARTTARLEPVGIPGTSASAAGDVTELYVARFRIPRPGTYWVVAEPQRATIQAIGNLVVRKETVAPGVGEKAIPSRTPTLRSARGDLSRLTTRTPPDRELLRYSVAESLAARKPFVVTFATPRFCTSRTCGPVVDVVDAVRKRFAGSDVRFIHVEIYEDNDPAKGVNRWVREWKLPTEPFTFLVGRDGRIKARFEGSVSAAELTAAVRTHLLAA